MPRRVWRQLLDRRIPQVVGVYLAGGWGMLEFSSWAAERALVPATVVDSLLVGWIAMLPVAVFLAWRSPREPGPVHSPGPHQRSVAVLPFENHSANTDDAYLSDGVTDEITTALSRIDGLRVASRTSTRALAAKGDIREIGSSLNVGSMLEGEVQRSGPRLRVSTRLVSVDDGYQLWSGRYDGDMEDVFAIQDEIAEGVAEALRVVLHSRDREGLRRAPRTDVQAYEYYLRGRQFFYQTRRKSLHFARAMFRKALTVDPDYAPAHAALADAIALEQMYYPEAEQDAGEADQASRRALELDPDLPEAHSARGLVLTTQHDYDEAEKAFAEAIRLDPNLYEAHYFRGRMLFQQGRFDEAARSFDDAVSARDDYPAAFFAAQAYEALGREEEAGARYRSAVLSVARHMELNPDDPRAATMRAVALCRTGRREEGLEWGRRAVEIDPEDAGVRYNLACLYAVAGDAEKSLDTLEAAMRVGFGNRAWLERDPDLDSVRDHPRFTALLERTRPTDDPVTPDG
jgi:adenylate cyclase